jgi:glycosyltransferase involved in cell wall biosynthesis
MRNEPRATETGNPLRLLIIDKVSVLRSIRERHVRLAERAAVDITLLTPERWVENFTMVHYQPSDGEPIRSIQGKVVWPGKEQRSFYLSGMVRAFRESRPEVVFLMEESFSLFALQAVILKLLLAPGARVVFYSNNVTSYDRYAYRPSWFYRILGTTVMKGCDVGLCVNTLAESVLRRSGFRGRIQTLFYGINERLFLGRSAEQSRRRIGLPERSEPFLYAGKLLPLKGVQDLIEAFALLRSESPGRDLRLVIVGKGPHAGELRSLATALQLDDAVSFHDMVPIEQVPDFIGAATALVLPSRAEISEQFGRVIAEAMLMGVPVIGSTSGGIPDVIGDGGFVFGAGDVGDLKRTMAMLLDQPEEALRRSRRGRELALRKYSMGSFVDGLIELFESISGRRLRREGA